MKMLIILTLVFAMQATASVYSQNTGVTLNFEQARLGDVLSRIEKDTEFVFFYRHGAIDQNIKVNIHAQNRKIHDVLNEMFRGTGIDWTVKDRLIILGNKETNDVAILQGITITGTVVDEAGTPLPGVNVVVKGTATGVISNVDGQYSITVPNTNAVLIFSFVGYLPQEIAVSNQTDISVAMSESVGQIEEVVVVGFGTQKKANLTGAVSVIKGDDIMHRPVSNASSMLQSQIPGLRVQIGTGEPGNQGISFRIRGQGTFSSAGSDPLILINGVPGSLDNIDPNTVESVSILKDAASAAVYGARAANGVVLVTTKTGENSPATVSYRGNLIWTTPTSMFDLVTDPAEYMTYFNMAADNSGRAGGRYSEADIAKYRNREPGYEGYDWIGENISSSISYHHNLNLMGGSERLSYNASLNYVNENGTMKGFEYEKYNFTLNTQSKVNKWITAGTYVNLNRYDRSQLRQGSEDAFLALMAQAPTYKPQREDGTWVKKAYDFEDSNKNVPALIANNVLRNYTGYETTGHLWLTLNLLDGLSWHTKGAATMRTVKDKQWRPVVPIFMYHDGSPAGNLDVGGEGLNVEQNLTFYTYLYSYLKYDFSIAGAHGFGLQFGYSQEANKYEWLNAYRQYYSFPLLELDAGTAAMQQNRGDSEEWALMGVFGRFNYNFKERYLFEANFRYDGTSRIARENRWGFFPSVSAAWRLTEEPMIKSALPAWFTNAKVRASWGQLGNQNIGLYPYQALISSGQNYTFDGDNLLTGYAQTAMNNRMLIWETTTTTDIGVDITLFGGLNITFDWYKKLTTDILRTSQVTSVLGLSAPTVNSGEMTNKGIELDIRYNGRVKEGAFRGLSYSAGFYIDRYRNELTKYGAREISGYNLREEGKPWDSYFMLEAIGVFATQKEIDDSPRQFSDNLRPGDLKYATNGAKDANGKDVVSDDSRVAVDGRFPRFEYAISASASWKGFDISLLMAGVEGKKWYVEQWGAQPFIQGSPPTKAYINGMWTPENPHNAQHPRLYWNDMGGARNTRRSTYWLHDASFLRLKNLTVGYTIPQQLTQKVSIQDVRFFLSGDNLFTFTKFPETDPERASDGRMVRYPQNRVFSLGLSVTF